MHEEFFEVRREGRVEFENGEEEGNVFGLGQDIEHAAVVQSEITKQSG